MKGVTTVVNHDQISTHFNLLNIPWVNLVTSGFSPLLVVEIRCVAVMMILFLRNKGKESSLFQHPSLTLAWRCH